MRREVLTWSDVDKLIDYLVPQIHGRFDSMLIITRGGIVPGGMLAEALNITYILTASIRFPADFPGMQPEQAKYAIPEFIQFPADELLEDRRILVVDDVWTKGATASRSPTAWRRAAVTRKAACCTTNPPSPSTPATRPPIMRP
jgi:uncharacterized protein